MKIIAKNKNFGQVPDSFYKEFKTLNDGDFGKLKIYMNPSNQKKENIVLICNK